MSDMTTKQLLARLNDEDGSAMTEFVIGLPVYIILFLGILNLGNLNIGGVLVKGQAHREMWEEAIKIQTGWRPDWAMNPVAAAGDALAYHNGAGGTLLDKGLDAAAGAGAITGNGGLLADSYIRVRPVDVVENIGGADGQITYDIDDIMAADDYKIAKTLMDDGVNYGAFSGVNSALGALNSLLTFTGARPALAAGIRYGISGGNKSYDVNLFGAPDVTLKYAAHVANAPKATPHTLTFAVVRLAMASEERYDTAIKFTLTPDLQFEYDTAGSDSETYQSCVNGNENLGEGEEPADCGDPPTTDGDAEDARDNFWDSIPCTASFC